MINIIININEDNDICGFVVNGHAKYAAYGHDIVCCAVTVLVFNTINGIKKFTNESINVIEKNGYIKCVIPNKNKDVSLLLNSMLLGLYGIEKEYSKNVNIKFSEVRHNGS